MEKSELENRFFDRIKKIHPDSQYMDGKLEAWIGDSMASSAAKSCTEITTSFCKELQKEFDRKFKEWENQKETIGNFHAVMKKHCDKYPDSENLNEFIIDLKSKLLIANKALEDIRTENQPITCTIATKALTLTK